MPDRWSADPRAGRPASSCPMIVDTWAPAFTAPVRSVRSCDDMNTESVTSSRTPGRQESMVAQTRSLATSAPRSQPPACGQAMGDEPVDPGRGRPLRGGGGIEQRREGEEHTGSSGEGAGERGRRVLERARRLGEDPELTPREPRAQVVDGGRAAQRGGQGELAEVPTDHLDPLEPPPQPRRHGIRVDQPQDRILGSDGRHDGPRGEHRVGLRGLDPPPAVVAAHAADGEVAADPPAEARRPPTAARRRTLSSRHADGRSGARARRG